jgi:hypothetical protein
MHAYAWTDASVKNVHSMEPCMHALVNNLYLQVDRRYRRYCEQMRALAGGFEAVAGERAAAAYTAPAARTPRARRHHPPGVALRALPAPVSMLHCFLQFLQLLVYILKSE